ncbi:hypothetical protein GPECTOR_30g256 [Gonium pectorale]|uniref:Uncharacterized protein n=1 Tax=Gonium pectorale TaxID=33097 RepID=A0A150GFQ8_GONPE|nr:hypothetical protein GPECTOR_30g256 [Gonium pectorale]|eukprot:KXZ48160.1 hypothetical protein GPECTOR_30g256 [Gonium pectorale]
MVLGDSSRRAAAKRAGLDAERLRQLRAVRARRGEDPAGRRFNHWDDGAGSWDCDTIGIDGADECNLRWEGVGSTTVGPRM